MLKPSPYSEYLPEKAAAQFVTANRPMTVGQRHPRPWRVHRSTRRALATRWLVWTNSFPVSLGVLFSAFDLGRRNCDPPCQQHLADADDAITAKCLDLVVGQCPSRLFEGSLHG